MRNVKKVIALVLVINMVMTNVMPSFARGWSIFSFLFNENSKTEQTELAEVDEVDGTTKLVDELIESTEEIVEEEIEKETTVESDEPEVDETGSQAHPYESEDEAGAVGADTIRPDEDEEIEATSEVEEPEEDETNDTDETTIEEDEAGSHPQEGSFGETHPYESEDESDAIEETTVELETLETIPNTVYSMLDEEPQGSGDFYLADFWYNAPARNGAREFLPIEEVTKVTFQRGGEAPEDYDYKWYIYSSENSADLDLNYWVWGYIVNGTEALVHFDDRVTNIYSPRGSAQLDKMFSFGVKDKNTGEIKSELREIIGIENITFRKLLYPTGIFRYDKKLERIDVSGFDMSSATDFSNMFEGCESLEELDLSSFNTQYVNNMSYMFAGCKNLKNLDLSSFDTSECNNMEGMFKDLESIETLDLSNFDTSKVTKMNYMFANLQEVTRIFASSKFNPTKATKCNDVFSGCPNLVGTYGYTDANGGTYGYQYARLDGKQSNNRGFLSLESEINTSILTIVDYETNKKYTTITKGKNVPVEISKTSRSIKSANAELSDAYFFVWVDEDGNEYQENDTFNVDKTQTIKLKYTRARKYRVSGLKTSTKFKDSAFKDGVIGYKEGYLYVEYDNRVKLPIGLDMDYDDKYSWSTWRTQADGAGELLTHIEADWESEKITIYAYMPENKPVDETITVGDDEALIRLYNLYGYFNAFGIRSDYKIIKKGTALEEFDPGIEENVGWEFKGWYEIDTSNSSSWEINRRNPYNFNTILNDEIKLCAYWEEKEYPIMWHSDEVPLKKVLYDNYSTKRYSEAVSLDMSLRDDDLGHGQGDWWFVWKDDYEFVGFYKDSDYRVKISELPKDTEGPYHIYVKWKDCYATVEYRDKNKGNWTEQIRRGSNIILPDMSDQVGFKHWYLYSVLNEVGDVHKSYEQIPCKNGEGYTLHAIGKYVFKSIYEEDYENLPLRPSFVRFETDYGKAPYNGSDKMVYLGDKIVNPGPPTGVVKGYKFSHWYIRRFNENDTSREAIASRLKPFDFENDIVDESFYMEDIVQSNVFRAYWVESDEEETSPETSPETTETTTQETTTPETTTKENPKETTKPAPQETTTQETTTKETTTKETIIETSDIAPAETKETNPAPQETEETKPSKPLPLIPCGGGTAGSTGGSGGSGGGGGGGGRGMSLPITSLENNKNPNQTQNQNQSDAKPASKNSFLFAENLSEWKYNTDDSWSMTVNINGQIVNATNGFYNIVKTENNVVTNSVYYFDEKGKMVTGWVKDSENNLYYFEPLKNVDFGKMSIGWKEINGESFYFGSDGKMMKNGITPDGKYVGEDGKLISAGMNIDAINQNNPFVRIV